MEEKLKIFADKYKKFGFNVSCVTNTSNPYNTYARSYYKCPSHPWKDLFIKPQEISEYNSYDWTNSVALGTFTYWKDLVVIDIDGCNDTSFLKDMLRELDLPQDYEWVIQSGSKNGYHIYYKGHKINECSYDDVVSTFPPKKEFEKYLSKIEFLWRTHAILPPSAHGSGNKYSFLRNEFPTNSPVAISTEIIYNFIYKFLDIKEIRVGTDYGEMTIIKSKTDFIPEFKDEDITKHLLNDVYLILDIETSGLPRKVNNKTKYPEIVQVAWLLSNVDGIVLKKNSYIIDTHFLSSNNRSEFINIDFEIARKVKFPLNTALQKLAEDIKTSDYIVAHNTEFDLEILANSFVKTYGTNPFKAKKQICTMKSTVNFCKIANNYGFKYPKLSELYFKLFDYQIKNSHNAEIDALNTLKCFKKLKALNII